MQAHAYLFLGYIFALCWVADPCIFAKECISDSSAHTSCAAQIFSPVSLEELQDVVKKAILDGVKIRAFGGLHSSITDVAVGPKNYLIDMTGLDKIFEIDFDNATVRVQGGTNLHQLSHELAKAGLRLLTQPGPYDATVGGMVANAVHESGLTGCLSDSILEIEFVDGMGNLRQVSATENTELLPAARVSLGVLGPIYSVTFQCYPADKRQVFASVTDLNTIISNINVFLQKYDNFQFLLDPVSKAALLQSFNKVDSPESNTSNRDYAHYLAQASVISELNAVLFPMLPSDTYAPISKAIVTSGVVDLTEFFYKSYSFFHSNFLSRGRISELSIEANDIGAALLDLCSLVQSHKNMGKDFIAFSEVRYVSDKNFMYLSPTNRPSWLIGLIIVFPDNSPDAIRLLAEFTALMQRKYKGRPQWGNNPAFLNYQQLIELYGQENVDAFNTVRRSFDPHGLFYTNYFQHRLGPL